MKRIAIIGTAGVPVKYGGFETLAHHLVLQLSKRYSLTVYGSKHYYSEEEQVPHWNGARVHYLPLNANGAQSVIYDIISMFKAFSKHDYFLVLGVSGAVLLPVVRLLSNKKIIVNIDGQEWRREKWGRITRKFLKMSEYIAVKFAHRVVTDNVALQDYVSKEYNKTSTLIEYGSDHVQAKRFEDVSFDGFEQVETYIKANMAQYAMKVCRIEPENNVHVVLEAFSKQSDKQLLMVGNWDYSEYGKSIRKQYDVFPNITLLDPIYEQDIIDQLRVNCSVYIHGHSAGGTNPSLVEAMGLGLPIIAFKVVFNVETTEHKALYFSDAKDLVEVLESTPQEKLNPIGQAMVEIAQRRYMWSIIANKYAELVESI